MKATYKEIKEIIKNTPDEIKGKNLTDFEFLNFGYYSPYNANWAYNISAIIYNNEIIKVVSSFNTIH